MTAAGVDVLDVLTRSGAARDAFCSQIGEVADVDAQLVSELLRSTGRVGATLDTRHALVELCALLRALDAADGGRIELAELRAGLAVHAARTDRFAAFHDARVLLRTLEELLARPDAMTVTGEQGAVHAQVRLLHRELRTWLLEQLTGSPHGLSADAPAPAAPREELQDGRVPITAPEARRAADALVVELQDGARHHPVTGLLGAAWLRDWTAVPVAGDRIGDDPAELQRLADALDTLSPPPTELLQVTRRPSPRWHLVGTQVHVGDQLRDGWTLAATAAGLRSAADPDASRPATVITTADLAFAYVEDDGWHALLGPREFIERVTGCTHLEALAAFRLHVEELAVEDEPPPDLLAVAMSFGRLRRRAR